MTDRELLELAARAAGMNLTGEWESGEVWHWNVARCLFNARGHDWSPLDDDGDALRLAVKLGMVVDVRFSKVRGMGGYNRVDYWPTGTEGEQAKYIACHDCDGDPYAATRRAIVRAAAEIGKAMTVQPEGEKR